MKGYIAIAVASILIFSFISYNVYADTKALKNIKMEIKDVKVERILPDILLKISIKFVNDEGRKIEGLEGEMEIYILNESVGYFNFSKIDIEKHSFKEVYIPLTLYYDKIARSIIEAIKRMDFNIVIKGNIRGKIFFGLITYSLPVEAKED